MSFRGGPDGKESACNAGDPGSIPGWGKSPSGGNGYPLLYSYLENTMDKEAWWTTAHAQYVVRLFTHIETAVLPENKTTIFHLLTKLQQQI